MRVLKLLTWKHRNDARLLDAVTCPEECVIDFSKAHVTLGLNANQLLFGKEPGPLAVAADGTGSRDAVLLHQRASFSYSADVEGLYSASSGGFSAASVVHQLPLVPPFGEKFWEAANSEQSRKKKLGRPSNS